VNISPKDRRPFPESVDASMHLLKFTGTCDRAVFETLCAQQDFWYHSYYFDNGFIQRDDYNIGLDIEGYGFPPSMRGMTVLDVGTGSGWFAAYFEQLGAAVTTIDLRGLCDWDIFNPTIYAEALAGRPTPDTTSRQTAALSITADQQRLPDHEGLARLESGVHQRARLRCQSGAFRRQEIRSSLNGLDFDAPA
jgi:hypothetical protein